MIFPTSFGGCCLFALNRASFVHNLALFLLLFTTVMTGRFKILSSMLKYVCFTMISTFNLTPSATGMTGRDGRKTLRFYQLIWLVASCPSLLALQYKEIVLFRALICAFWHSLGLVVLVINWCFESLSAFLGCFLCSTSLWIGECVSTFYMVSSLSLIGNWYD